MTMVSLVIIESVMPGDRWNKKKIPEKRSRYEIALDDSARGQCVAIKNSGPFPKFRRFVSAELCDSSYEAIFR